MIRNRLLLHLILTLKLFPGLRQIGLAGMVELIQLIEVTLC